MTKGTIISELTSIFREVLDKFDLSLNEETSANDLMEWDSISHIQLIVAIERSFNIRFTSNEIRKLTNVGDICKIIISKNNK